MIMNSKEALKIEKENRKEIARKRICYLLLCLDILLVIYFAIQIIFLVQGK